MGYTIEETRQRLERDNAFIKAIDEICKDQGRTFANAFEDWLDFMLAVFCGNPNDRQKQLHEEARQKPELWSACWTAFRLYGEAAEDYHDPFGAPFMERISHGQNGQFFTPEHICTLMAETVDTASDTISDPCCGSGRLLLAGLKTARANGKEPEIVACDLTSLCSRMTLMNLLINTAHGCVMCGDSLAATTDGFTFYRIDNIRRSDMADPSVGVVTSHYWQYTKDTAKDVDTFRMMWYLKMSEHGVRYFMPTSMVEDVVKTLPTEIIKEENGQLRLF